MDQLENCFQIWLDVMADSDNPDEPEEVTEVAVEKPKAQEVFLLDSDEEDVVKNGDKDDVAKAGDEESDTKNDDKEDVVKNGDDASVSKSDSEGGGDTVVVGGEARRKVIVSWQCLNPECTVSRKELLVTADSYSLSYHGLEQDSARKRKVCFDCRDRVEDGRRGLVDKLRSKVKMGPIKWACDGFSYFFLSFLF